MSCFALFDTGGVKVIIDGAATFNTVPSEDLYIPGTIKNVSNYVTTGNGPRSVTTTKSGSVLIQPKGHQCFILMNTILTLPSIPFIMMSEACLDDANCDILKYQKEFSVGYMLPNGKRRIVCEGSRRDDRLYEVHVKPVHRYSGPKAASTVLINVAACREA